MKYFLIATLFSLGIHAAEYSSNDGVNPPGTFTDKGGLQKSSPKTTELEVIDRSTLNPQKMNTSPNPAPSSAKDILENTTLYTDRFNKPKEIQAQEEGPLNYSTTPQKRPKLDKTKSLK